MERDPLSDVLQTVRLSGAVFFLWEPGRPFAMAVPDGGAFTRAVMPGAGQIVSYHIVTAGTCWGGLLGQAPVELREGDILLLPRGDAYAIADSADNCRNAEVDLPFTLGFFGQMAAGELPFVVRGQEPEAGRSPELVCGFLGCDLQPFNPVLAALPPMVRLRPEGSAPTSRLQALLEHVVGEARRPGPGSQCVVTRLGELLFVEVVRHCLTLGREDAADWLGALDDPVAGRALVLMHREPARRWTLDTLASRLGVSRTRLAERFTRRVGQPPMQYLARWRLQLAVRLLGERRMKVAAVAREVGYESEAAFSRAFKRALGVSPARWAREPDRQ